MIRLLLKTIRSLVLLTLLLSIMGTNELRADMVLSLSSSTTVVVQGGQLVIDINLQSDVDNELIYGMDLLVLAGVADGSQGTFSQGTVNIAPAAWDLTVPGEAFLGVNITTPFDTLAANTVHQVGQLTLDLSGVAPGSYSATIDDAILLILTKDASDNFVPINSSKVDFAFSITAVPEPSSILLYIVAFPLFFCRRSRTAIV